MEQRPHFSYVLYDLKRFRVLILVPLIRLFIQFLRHRQLQFHRYELVILATMIGYSLLKWVTCRYRLTSSGDDRIHTIGVRQGIVFRRVLHISAEDAASIEIERTPFLWLLGGRRIRVNTAGVRRRSDVQLYLSAARTREVFTPQTGTRNYRASRLPVLILSLTGSNAAVGALTAAPFINRFSRFLGENTVDVVGQAAKLLQSGLPSTLRLLANVLVIGWGVSAIGTFSRYVGFRARREAGQIHLVSGLFTRRDVLIGTNKVTALELRQTLTMRLFSLYTAVITAAGYGRELGARPVLIPAARQRGVAEGLECLLPKYPVCAALLRPTYQARWRYLLPPLAMLVFGTAIGLMGRWWRTVATVVAVWAAWWLIVRIWGWRQAGFGCNNEAVSLCYPRGLAVYRVHFPIEVVDCVSVTRSYFQRRRGTCTVRVRCFGEKKRTHRVWGIPYHAVCRMLIKQKPH